MNRENKMTTTKKPRKYTQKNGTITYKLNGKYHRENGPAVEYPNGDKSWYINGKLHREDGPAVEWSNGTKYWYLNDKLHRENGPAVEKANGSKYWYKDGELHREDGPAYEGANGEKKWYLNGEQLTEGEFNKIKRKKNGYRFAPGKIDISICPVCDNENTIKDNKQYAICDNCEESYIVV